MTKTIRAKPRYGCKKRKTLHFLETYKLWSTYFDTFRKPSASATKTLKFVGQSSQTSDTHCDGSKKRKTHTFSKLMNFGAHNLTLLKSSRPVLQDARNLWVKVQKRQRYRKECKKQKTPTFAKIRKFFSKNTSDLKKKHLSPKSVFSRKKNLGVR